MSNYPSFLSLFLPGQHVSTGDVGKSRPLRGRAGGEEGERESMGELCSRAVKEVCAVRQRPDLLPIF